MAIENLKFTEDQKKFVTDEISRLKGLENRNQTEDLILSLVKSIESGSPTKQQISSFERVMKNEFKKHKARIPTAVVMITSIYIRYKVITLSSETPNLRVYKGHD